MLKNNLITIKALLIIILACPALLTSFKNKGSIALLDEPAPLKAAGYYIAEVTDDRAAKSPVAQLLMKAPDGKFITQSNDLQGGPQAAVSRFLAHNLSADASALPVVINIKEIKVIETMLTGNRVDGQIKLSLAFGLQKEYGTQPLVNYQGGMHYIRPVENTAAVEPQLRKTLLNGIIFLNTWLKNNQPHHVKLAKQVKISFTNYTEKHEGDTIYYSFKRPLTWADFQSHIASRSPYTAHIMPGIAYDQEARVTDGTVYVNVALKTYVPKSTCWVNPMTKDEYSLNHEQRHFDIVKVIAERYKHKVLTEPLTPETYEAFINMEYLEAYREMYNMQKAYDKETSHGINTSAQSAWNDRIDKELKTYTKL
jgi:hypothetical protein